jgi:hypothetical protein
LEFPTELAVAGLDITTTTPLQPQGFFFGYFFPKERICSCAPVFFLPYVKLDLRKIYRAHGRLICMDVLIQGRPLQM